MPLCMMPPHSVCVCHIFRFPVSSCIFWTIPIWSFRSDDEAMIRHCMISSPVLDHSKSLMALTFRGEKVIQDFRWVTRVPVNVKAHLWIQAAASSVFIMLSIVDWLYISERNFCFRVESHYIVGRNSRFLDIPENKRRHHGLQLCSNSA